MKKAYVSPSIKTEMIEVGVFGCHYGGYSGGGYNHYNPKPGGWWSK